MAGLRHLLFLTIAASLLLSKGTAVAQAVPAAQAPGTATVLTPAQGQAAVATAKQANPAGVAGLSAAVNSKTAICSIPAGNGGKLINAPTLDGTGAAGVAAVAPPTVASASGRRLMGFGDWFSSIGEVFTKATDTISNVATQAAGAVNTAAAATVKALDNAASATGQGLKDAAVATADGVQQQAKTIGIAAGTVVTAIGAAAAPLIGVAPGGAVPTGEVLAETIAERLALAGLARKRSLLTEEPLSSQSARRLLAPALAPPAPNTQSTSTMFGSAGKNVTLPASIQVASIPACCQSSPLPAGATAASLEQMYGLPTGSVSLINADNAFSTPGGSITLPCPRFLGWLTAVNVGLSIALPPTK